MVKLNIARWRVSSIGWTLALIAIVCCAMSPSFAAADQDAHWQQNAADIDRIEQGLSRGANTEERLRVWNDEVLSIKFSSQECVAQAERDVAKLEQDLASLGAAPEVLTGEAALKRRALEQEKQGGEARLASCRLLLLRSDEAQRSIAGQHRSVLTERLSRRGANFISVLKTDLSQAPQWLGAGAAYFFSHTGVEALSIWAWAVLLAILLITARAGLRARRTLRAWAAPRAWDESFTDRFNHALILTCARFAPHLLMSAAAALFLYVLLGAVRPLPALAVLGYGFLLYFAAWVLVRVLFAPPSPAALVVDMPLEVAQALARRLNILFWLVFGGYLVFSSVLAPGLPEAAFLLARGVFAALVVLNLIWALWLIGRIPAFARTLWLRAVLWLALTAGLVAELAGYRELSLMVWQVVIGTVAAIGGLYLASRLFRELFNGFDEGRGAWARYVRGYFGIETGESVPGLMWLRMTVLLVLWFLFGAVVLRVWGLHDSIGLQIYQYLVEGFPVGSLTIVPARVLLALIVFILVFAISGWLRARLEKVWLINAPMDRGAREALVSIAGYAGGGIAILTALAVAGVEFSNLAIIAGALSVGIGFGLQNIVNNFISGLILLFERPIKSGDWVVVGGTEGFVKRIRIRSTQIQTFDRADVIVPNSELISGQVTNWMLQDARGRIKIPIGVAYGSDTQLVKETLLSVAWQHPLVIKGEADWEPKVLFLNFGESSLDFELRVFIREIDRRFDLQSDLNFAIDAAFRARGIEIPFPQRDLHVKNWPANMAPRPADDA